MSVKASLLGIPPEVRRMVLQEVARIPWPTPYHPTCLLDQKRRDVHKDETGAFAGERHVLFEESPTPNSMLPLLLTNRPLHDETRGMLRHEIATRLPNYIIDVMYLKDCTLWPTWLSVPVQASHVDSVTAQFRLFNRPGDMPIAYKQQRRGIFGRNIIWPFYHILVATIKFGPCGRPITIRKLVLDFLPTEEEDILPLDPSTLGPTSVVPDNLKAWDFYEKCLPPGWTPPHDPQLIAPAMVLNFLKEELGRLLSLNVDYFDHCKNLYESIGEIHIHLAGKLYANFDLAKELARWKIWGPPGSFRYEKWHSEFCPWRPQVEARRRELGMPVKDRA